LGCYAELCIEGGMATDHWWSLNDGFQGLTSHPLKTSIGLLMAQTV